MSHRFPLSTVELRVLHIYRRVPQLITISDRAGRETRWARICREMGDHISRSAYDDEDGVPRAVADTFEVVDHLVDFGYLDGSMPSWSLYRLTEQGAALLDRWKKAGFPR